MGEQGDDGYDSNVMGSEIRRIRARLRRLDEERRAAAAELAKAMRSANQRLHAESLPADQKQGRVA